MKADLAAADDAKRGEAVRQQVTLGDVWLKYIAARKHKWGKRHTDDHIRFATIAGAKKKRGKGVRMAGPLAPLLEMKLSDLTGERLTAWLTKETLTRPTSVALSFRLLRGCLNWCETESDFKGLVTYCVCGTSK